MVRSTNDAEGRSASAAPADGACLRVGVSPADPLIESLADEVALLIRGSELLCAFRVGALVTERILAGDPTGWHRKGPKSASLADLASALSSRGVGSASALFLCLGVHETLAPLGDPAQWKCLTRNHIRVVLPLPMAERERLLRQAETEGWTSHALAGVARTLPRPRALGRRSMPPFVSVVRKIVALTALDGPAFRGLDRVGELDQNTVDELHTGLIRAQEQIEKLEARLSPKRHAAVRSACAIGPSPREGETAPGGHEPRRRKD